MRFSPLGAGVTALAFSAGSFALAGGAVPLAQRFARRVIASGALLMALGALAIRLGADHVGNGRDPWPVVPGLIIAGIGLSLLIIPLVTTSFKHALVLVVGLLVGAGVLALALPRTAVGEAEVAAV